MTRSADLAIELDLGAPSRARRFVSEKLADWNATCRIDDALLLASELVTNAVEYGAAPASLRVAFGNEVIDIEVRDASIGRPVSGTLGAPLNEKGRGLALVEALADAWGVTDLDDLGKTVWFKLALPANT
jgi:anti-sigma regulatory factor (Ser/Thr protein kinase)